MIRVKLQVVSTAAIPILRLDNHWVATVLRPWRLNSEEFYQRDGVRKHEQRNREVRRQNHGELKHNRCVRLAVEKVQWRRHGIDTLSRWPERAGAATVGV